MNLDVGKAVADILVQAIDSMFIKKKMDPKFVFVGRGYQGAVYKIRVLGRWYLVKTHLYGIDVLLKEVEMHIFVWTNVSSKDRKYFAKPYLVSGNPIITFGDQNFSVQKYMEGYVPLISIKPNTMNQTKSEVLTSNIAHAIYAMHRIGVIHGDLHSKNALVQPETMNIKIIDFGFARFIKNTKNAASAFLNIAFLQSQQGYKIGNIYNKLASEEYMTRSVNTRLNSYRKLYEIGVAALNKMPESYSPRTPRIAWSWLLQHPPERWQIRQPIDPQLVIRSNRKRKRPNQVSISNTGPPTNRTGRLNLMKKPFVGSFYLPRGIF